jgi:hypothetical protein
MQAIMEAVGLVGVEFSERRWDTFSDAPSASSAAAFGTQGVAFRASKPRSLSQRRLDGRCSEPRGDASAQSHRARVI